MPCAVSPRAALRDVTARGLAADCGHIQAGLAGHLTIGNSARIAAKAGVMRDVATGETVCGIPAFPMRIFMKQVAILQRLARKKDGG